MRNYILVIFSVLTLAAHSQACFHYSKDYKGKLRSGLHEMFLFHDGQNAHAVFRVTLKAKKYPKEMAWVLPFPSLPTKYEEINGPLFNEIYSFMPYPNPPGISRGRIQGEAYGGSSKGGIKVHETVAVGNYVIQPIEILNEGSGNEFNAWLKKNKFNPMPLANQKYYLKKGATFLAIRMDMTFPFGEDLVSKPLHIVYSSDRVSAPIKFTHDSRQFDLDLYVFSSKELNKDLSSAFLEKIISGPYENKKAPFLDDLIKQNKGFITLYRASGLNSPKKSIKKIPDDPFFLKSEI